MSSSIGLDQAAKGVLESSGAGFKQPLSFQKPLWSSLLNAAVGPRRVERGELWSLAIQAWLA